MHTLRRTGTISPIDLSASLRDYIVIDIRRDTDWRRGHLPGSVSVRADQIEQPWIDPDPRLPVVVVADDEIRAEHAAAHYRSRGRDAVVLRGAYAGWVAAGGCIVCNRTDVG